MLEFLHVHFNFLCRTKRINPDGRSPIVLRVIFRKERRDIYTGLYCDASEWDSKSGKLVKSSKDATGINKNLELINHRAHNAFEALQFSGQPFSIDELVSKLKGKEKRPALLIEFLQKRNQEIKLKTGIDIAETTSEKYERSLKHVLTFLETTFKIKNYPLINIDGKFLEQYFQYLRTVKEIGHNTAVKYLTSFRTMLMPAILSGEIRKNPFREVKFRTKKVHKHFLTDEEIEQISGVNPGSPDLTRIRDIFLFACYTGLSYSDLKQLAKHHIIKQGDGDYYIIKPRQKTDELSLIPLLPAAISILQKYSITKDFRDFKWHVSANQKMNQRLKLIGEKAGITKVLHMHLARHTFATTITLSNGVPLETVSNMLGHANLKQTQHYAKIVALKVIRDMDKVKTIYR
jgi:site-specific recombinase XerD